MRGDNKVRVDLRQTRNRQQSLLLSEVCHLGSRIINQRTSLCILLSKTLSQSTSHDSHQLTFIKINPGDRSTLSYLTPILCLFHVYDNLVELPERSKAKNTRNILFRQKETW